MKTLSEFLAKYILNNRYITCDKEWKEMLEYTTKEIHNGLKEYIEYLVAHKCKTVHWKEIEKQIVDAITKAESAKSV